MRNLCRLLARAGSLLLASTAISSAATFGIELDPALQDFQADHRGMLEQRGPRTGVPIELDPGLDAPGTELENLLPSTPERSVDYPLYRIIDKFDAANPGKARDALSTYLDENPDDLEGWLTSAIWAIVDGDREAAASAIDHARAIAPRDPRVDATDGLLQASSGNAFLALRTFQDVLRRDPKNFLALRISADVHRQIGQADKARDAYRRLSKAYGLSQSTMLAHLEWAEVLMALGETDRARELLSQVRSTGLATGPMAEHVAILTMRSAMQGGDLDGAFDTATSGAWRTRADEARLYEAQIRWRRDHDDAALLDIEAFFDHPELATRARIAMAEIEEGAGRSHRALQQYEAALDTAKGEERLRLTDTLVARYKAAGESDKAEALLRDGVSRDDYISSLMLADFLTQEMRHMEALDVLQAAVAEHPQASNLHYIKGINHYFMGQRPEAEAAFRLATATGPDNARAWISLGKIIHERGGHGGPGRHVDVIALYEEALRHSPNHPIILLELGKIAGEEGRLDDSIPLLRSAIEHGGAMPLARSFLALAVARKDADYTTADRLVSDALKMQPNHVHPLFVKGRILLLQGNAASAAGWFDRANKARPSHGHSLAFAAEAYHQLGNDDLALDRGRRALTLALRDEEVAMVHDVMRSIQGDASAEATVHQIDAEGVQQEIGKVTFTDSAEGMKIDVVMDDLPTGMNGFHVHQNPSCDPGYKDGVLVAGLAAGAHFGGMGMNHDAGGHGAHGKHGGGHAGMLPLGDLPHLMVAAPGEVHLSVMAPKLRVSLIRNRAVMLHEGLDGPRIACGVIK
ncbi:tetratricopeptide repeat protein [Rhodobacteraceae bacterium NNCM2]|nr:tetratricopeptide repeat protein [Coraliihabitans acroporae]